MRGLEDEDAVGGRTRRSLRGLPMRRKGNKKDCKAADAKPRHGLHNMRRAALAAVALLSLPMTARADAGIPMLPVAYPIVLLFLLPVIAIEAIYLRARLKTGWWQTIKGVSIVNAVTTLLGYPLAWLLSFLVEILLMITVDSLGKVGISDRVLFRLSWLGFLVPAWIGPTDQKWPVMLAFAVLLLPSFLLSGYAEGRIVRHYGLLGFEGETSAGPITLLSSPGAGSGSSSNKAVARAVWMANVWSYLFLLCAGCLTLYLWLLRYDKRP
jgi:hypothetical protein